MNQDDSTSIDKQGTVSIISDKKKKNIENKDNKHQLEIFKKVVDEAKSKGKMYSFISVAFLIYYEAGKNCLTKSEIKSLIEKEIKENPGKIISSHTGRCCLITLNNYRKKIKDIFKKRKWFLKEKNKSGDIIFKLKENIIAPILPRLISQIKSIETNEDFLKEQIEISSISNNTDNLNTNDDSCSMSVINIDEESSKLNEDTKNKFMDESKINIDINDLKKRNKYNTFLTKKRANSCEKVEDDNKIKLTQGINKKRSSVSTMKKVKFVVQKKNEKSLSNNNSVINYSFTNNNSTMNNSLMNNSINNNSINNNSIINYYSSIINNRINNSIEPNNSVINNNSTKNSIINPNLANNNPGNSIQNINENNSIIIKKTDKNDYNNSMPIEQTILTIVENSEKFLKLLFDENLAQKADEKVYKLYQDIDKKQKEIEFDRILLKIFLKNNEKLQKFNNKQIIATIEKIKNNYCEYKKNINILLNDYCENYKDIYINTVLYPLKIISELSSLNREYSNIKELVHELSLDEHDNVLINVENSYLIKDMSFIEKFNYLQMQEIIDNLSELFKEELDEALNAAKNNFDNENKKNNDGCTKKISVEIEALNKNLKIDINDKS